MARSLQTRSWPLQLCLLLSSVLNAQETNTTFAERLNWPKGSTVVILHVDDVGMSHPSNLGAIESIEKGVSTSFSVMMTCPWVPEIARYLKDHPDTDSGLHLTLTSEWQLYRWHPLAGRSVVPGLVDPEGCLWRSVAQVVAKATPDEIETEIRAQINRAEGLGIPITHLDSHMGTLFARGDYFERFLKVGIEKRIPILAPGGHAHYASIENGPAVQLLRHLIPKIWNARLPVIDDLHTSSGSWPVSQKSQRLIALLKELKPGITEILFHASRPTEEFPLITGSSASRFADLQALTDPTIQQTIRERRIILTTWRELMKRRQLAASIP